MKLFKNVDEKLSDIGFVKTSENQYGATYERKNEKYNYVQAIDFMHKENGNHIFQSYQKNVNSDGFNNVVGLTAYEIKLALKKMHQLGLN